MKKKRVIVSIAIALFILFMKFGTPKYNSMRVDKMELESFKQKVLNSSSQDSQVDLKECTDFLSKCKGD